MNRRVVTSSLCLLLTVVVCSIAASFLVRRDHDQTDEAPPMYGDVVLRCAAIGPDGNETHVNVFPTSLNELNHQRLDFGRAPPFAVFSGATLLGGASFPYSFSV